jgi:hypothetical protein
VKVVFKGKRLDPNASFAAQGVGNAAKLMVLASSPTEIEKVALLIINCLNIE